RRRHTRFSRDWSSDVCSSDLDKEQRRSRVPAGPATGVERAQGGFGTGFAQAAQEGIWPGSGGHGTDRGFKHMNSIWLTPLVIEQIGRASCREGGEDERGEGDV